MLAYESEKNDLRKELYLLKNKAYNLRNFSTFAAMLKILNPQCIAIVVRTPPDLALYSKYTSKEFIIVFQNERDENKKLQWNLDLTKAQGNKKNSEPPNDTLGIRGFFSRAAGNVTEFLNGKNFRRCVTIKT